jgi:hypothetical protein
MADATAALSLREQQGHSNGRHTHQRLADEREQPPITEPISPPSRFKAEKEQLPGDQRKEHDPPPTEPHGENEANGRDEHHQGHWHQ